MFDISTRLLNCARDGRKRFFQHFAGEIDQGACSVGWRTDEDVSGIEPGTSLLVRYFRIEKH
jgi:hypothetical protein